MFSKRLLSIALIVFIFVLTGCSQSSSDSKCLAPVVINEFVASNASTLADEDDDFEDWIELYNCTDSAVDLSGWGLSDNLNRPFKWVFEDTSIEPNEYLIIWASGKDRQQAGLPLHTNFKINTSGEPLLLTRPSGETVDQIDAIEVPGDVSYGRYPDGAESLYYFDQPTPGEQNLQPTAQEILSPPVFSKPSGFYEHAFNLTISHPDPDVTIYYTLDGSTPNPENLNGSTYRYKNQYPQNPGDPIGEFLEASYQTHKYSRPLRIQDRTQEPDRLSQISTTFDSGLPAYLPQPEIGELNSIQVLKNDIIGFANSGIRFINRVLWFGFRAVRKIFSYEVPFLSQNTFSQISYIEPPLIYSFKGTSIRAIAIRDQAYSSVVVTHNYFIAPGNTFSLPVVAITVPEKDLFDFDNGIMVAGRRFETWRAENPEAPANGGTPANWSHRGEDVASHLQLFTDDLVIDQEIGIRPHGGWSRAQPHKSLRLYARSDYGQNSFDYSIFPDQPYNSYKRLILRNSGNDEGKMFHDAAIQRIVSNLSFSTQAYQPAVVFINAEYRGILNFRERYDKYYFARRYGAEEERIDLLTWRAQVKLGDNTHWNNLIDLLETHDVTQYEIYHQVHQKMDIQNFIDYQIANIFANNRDWPHNNIDYWRYRTEVVSDELHPKDGRWRWLMFDTDFGFGLSGNYTVNTLEHATKNHWSTFLLRTLLENEAFKHQFITRFADLLNSDFQSQRMVAIIHQMQAVIEPEMPRHIQRWGRPANMEDWYDNIKVMTDFAEKRPSYQRQHILEFFNLEGEYQVELNVSDAKHGQIRINSLTINEETEGVEGEPYPWRGQYFKGVPIELEAIAEPGYRFSHWSGVDSDSSTVTIDTEHDLKIMAYFVADN